MQVAESMPLQLPNLLQIRMHLNTCILT